MIVGSKEAQYHNAYAKWWVGWMTHGVVGPTKSGGVKAATKSSDELVVGEAAQAKG